MQQDSSPPAPTTPEVPMTDVRLQTRRRAAVFIVAGLVLTLAVALTLIRRSPNPPPASAPLTGASDAPAPTSIAADLPTPTPMPFAELTIPYLRARSYTSQLGELARSSETATYTSYLTSFDSDGFRVNGLLTIPKGERPADGWPAIVFVHGYIPPKSYRTTQNYNAYVDAFARNGFVVYKIDLRGHDQSEGEASGAYYSSDYVIDVLNARAALASSAFVDARRIGLWGHSMAGNVTFRAFTVARDIPALVIWAGAVYSYEDFQSYGIQDGSYRPPATDSPAARRRRELMETHGEFDPAHPFWKQVPATNYLDGVTGAIQLHHPIDDRVVSIDYSRNLTKLLAPYSAIEIELFEYQSGGHNLTGATFTQAMQRGVEFFEKNL